jgi:hypothetical protein
MAAPGCSTGTRPNERVPVKALVGANRLGPAAVFLPDGSHAVIPAAEALVAPLAAEVAARGPQASWEEHAARLCAGAGYAGRWSQEDVPDGISAQQALHLARYRAAKDLVR